MDDKLKDRLQKLKNLAERGVGGEKETAEKKLAQLLKDNGLTESDLNNDAINYYLFSFKYPYREKLLGQVIYKVLGASQQYAIYHSRGTRNKLGIYCTAAQKLEIELDYEFYCNLFDQEIEVLLAAFIAKQDIYPKDAPVSSVKPEDLTSEELEKYRKRDAYANQMDHRTRSAMIEDRENEQG